MSCGRTSARRRCLPASELDSQHSTWERESRLCGSERRNEYRVLVSSRVKRLAGRPRTTVLTGANSDPSSAVVVADCFGRSGRKANRVTTPLDHVDDALAEERRDLLGKRG